MRAEEVALYLQNNPKFFEEHVETLSQIHIPHPHGGRTISLSERQLLALREKNRELEKSLREMVACAKENEALQHKVHQFVIALFAARDLETLQESIPQFLQDIFAIPHSVLRVWNENPPSAETLAFTDAQAQPVCLHHAAADTGAWFGEHAAQLHSFAYMPLRESNGEAVGHSAATLRGLRIEDKTIGLLILASEDKQRFYPEMGTLFLQRIAESVSSAVQPFIAY